MTENKSGVIYVALSVMAGVCCVGFICTMLMIHIISRDTTLGNDYAQEMAEIRKQELIDHIDERFREKSEREARQAYYRRDRNKSRASEADQIDSINFNRP